MTPTEGVPTTFLLHRVDADDDVDAVLFRKIKSGKYDADDPVWDGVSAAAKDLIVSPLVTRGSVMCVERRPGLMMRLVQSSLAPLAKHCMPEVTVPSPSITGDSEERKHSSLQARLLVVQSRSRLTADQALAHPWLQA